MTNMREKKDKYETIFLIGELVKLLKDRAQRVFIIIVLYKT